jgi:hypothetical protein
MSPTVEAALISGGWATAVALLGYAFNRATTRANIAATNTNAIRLDEAKRIDVTSITPPVDGGTATWQGRVVRRSDQAALLLGCI